MADKSKPKFDPEAFLAKVEGGVSIAKYGKGQVIFAQGDAVDSVFYIREGRVKISVVSAQGKEAVVAFLKAGDFIGEGCCLTGRARRVATARALEDSVITRDIVAWSRWSRSCRAARPSRPQPSDARE